MAAKKSSTVSNFWRLATAVINSTIRSGGREIIFRRNSRSSSERPCWIFSSRRSFLNQLRILLRAPVVLTIFSQSRLGPWSLALEVITSMICPVYTWVSRATIRPSTLAPIIRLPTAVWMA